MFYLPYRGEVKSRREKIYCILTCIWNLEKELNESFFRARNRDADIEISITSNLQCVEFFKLLALSKMKETKVTKN